MIIYPLWLKQSSEIASLKEEWEASDRMAGGKPGDGPGEKGAQGARHSAGWARRRAQAETAPKGA